MPVMSWRFAVLPALVLAGVFAVTPHGFAAILSVTSSGDTTPGGAPGELRFHINNAAPGDTIVIPPFTITLTGGAAEDANASGDLDITKSLTIQGAGEGMTIIDGGGIDRVFDIIFADGVNISGMTIRNGKETIDGFGGGIDRSMAFPVLKALSRVNEERAKAAGDDPRFSVRIREGLPRMSPDLGRAGATQ